MAEISKSNAYVVLSSYGVSKANAYVVLSTEVTVGVSKAVAYVVLEEASAAVALESAIEVSADLTANLTLKDLKSYTIDFTTTGTVDANLILPKLKSSIAATAQLAANITGTWSLVTDITAAANLSAQLTNYARLEADVTVDGELVAEARLNTRYLTCDIEATATVDASLFAPWHGGSTVAFIQTVGLDLVKNETVEHELNLTHLLNLVFGQRSFSLYDTLVFTHEVLVKRVLPTETTDSTLSFTDSLAEYRNGASYLNLQHTLRGLLYYIDASASSALNLTDSASTETLISRGVTSQLNLTHLVDWDQVTLQSVLSNLYLYQNAFAVTLASKKYVLLQAPFDFIQTSVVLPNPLLDDNESLVSNLILRRSMDNTPYTYIKTSKSRRLRYTFILNRMKALELEAFFDAYNGAHIKMLNWKGEIWKVKLITNPIDFVQTRRAEPGGDRTDVNLEFEGVLLNG